MDSLHLRILPVVWIIIISTRTIAAQDRIPVTMVTTNPIIDSNNRPEYRCYVSSPDRGVTVTSRRVVDIWPIDRNNAEPSRPVRVTDQPYPANSTVYKSTAPGFIGNHDAGVGVFSCDVIKEGTANTTVSNVILRSNTFSRPSDDLVTQTVNVGDTSVRLEMDLTAAGGGAGIASWRRNGGQPFSTDSTYFNLPDTTANTVIEFIPEIIDERHEGVYVPQHANIPGPGNSPDRGIKRLIVRNCSANHWAPPGCFGVCDYCYNGGVCDDETGRCICAPGFRGPNCLTACGGNRFGPDCEFQCKYDGASKEASCSGLQFCLLDPYGCSCNTGWKDLTCRDACDAGKFGASCLQSCNCEGDCNRFTGACGPNGTCAAGWSGETCQIPDVCPTGYYGGDCTEKCYCKDDVACDKANGECPNQQCAPVYMVYPGSVKCQECRGAFFGESCLQKCHCPEEYCDKVSGRCRGSCLPQWTDASFCVNGLQEAILPRFNPGTTAEVRCVASTSGAQTVHVSRDSSMLDTDGIVVDDGVLGPIGTFIFTVANLTDGVEVYCLMLENQNIVAVLNGTAYEYVLPELTTAPILLNAGTNDLNIEWRAWSEVEDVGDPPIVAYVPYYRSTGGEQWIRGDPIPSNGSLTYTASGLPTDTLHELSVSAVREGENGEGPMGTIARFRTICDVSGVSPVNVAATVNETVAGVVNVSWQRPTDIDCTTGISFFFIYSVEEGNEPFFLGQAGGDESWKVLEDLGEGNYSFVVTLVIDGESDFSQMTESLSVRAAVVPPVDDESNAVIIVIIVILIIAVIVASVLALFIYRKRVHDDEEKRLVGYNQNGMVSIGGASNPYSAEEEQVKKLGDETESEEEIDEDDEEGFLPKSRAADIRVSKLREYINTNLQDGRLEEEFSRLHPGKQYPWSVAEKRENRTKNRFRNMYTYDHSRVVLDKLPDDPDSDYYNASFIMTDEDSRPFIAAQGPNKASLNDFWRMVWSQNVSTIVMVTSLEEKGRERCLQYWPADVDKSCMFGDIEVYWKAKSEFADYVIRTLECGDSSQTRTVQQLHFTSWPDMGTPKQPTPLIAFTKHAKMMHENSAAPMLVHCSAGIGRTGTFIALYTLLDVVLREESVNVYTFVEKIRESRINMVQTGKQYVYLYKCLLEASLTTETEIPRGQISQIAEDGSMAKIRKEYEILHELECDTLVYADYLKKQAGGRRPFSMSEKSYNLTFYVEGNLLKSFKKGDAFVTAKHPDDDNHESLWKLVHSWKCPIMVTLDNTSDKPYWPRSGSVKYSTTTVHFKSTETDGPLTIREFEVTRGDEQEEIALKHVELTVKPASNNVEAVVTLVTAVNKMHAQCTLEGPIIVLCENGEAMSGVFCAVLSEIERLAVTEKMDMFKTVRQLKETNGNIVPSEMDYLLCYKILFAYLEGTRYENTPNTTPEV